jgi:hypothetical protein
MFSRRQVMKYFGAATGSLILPVEQRAHAQPSTRLGCAQNRIQVIDADFTLLNWADKVRDTGVKTVARYYDRDYGSGPTETCWHNDTKRLTKRELQAIEEAGLSVIVLLQHCGANCLSFQADNSSTAEKGRKDATAAIQQAQDLGQPDDTPIYFGIDFDPVHGSSCKLPIETIWASIETYFNQINEVFAKTRWQVGIYAAGHPCQFVKERNLAKYFWLSAAMAHEGTHSFFNRGGWHIFQNRIDLQKNYGRKSEDFIDTNVVNPNVVDPTLDAGYFGQWTSKARAPAHDIETSLDILQSRAFMRAACGYKKNKDEKSTPRGSFNATCRIMIEERDGYFGINMTEGDDIECYIHESDVVVGMLGNMPKFEAAKTCAPPPPKSLAHA